MFFMYRVKDMVKVKVKVMDINKGVTLTVDR